MPHFLENLYETYKKGDGWWYRCRKCGAQAGGYKDEATAKLMAERHVMNPAHDK